MSNLSTKFKPVFELTFYDLFCACDELYSNTQEPQYAYNKYERLLYAFESTTNLSNDEYNYIYRLLNKIYYGIKNKFINLNYFEEKKQNTIYAIENSIAEGHIPDYSTVSKSIEPASFCKLTKHTSKWTVLDHSDGSVYTIYAESEDDLMESIDIANCQFMQVPNSFQPKYDIQHKDI